MRLPLDPACFLTIDIRRSRFAQLSVFLMAAAAVFRILYFWGFWKDPAVTAAAAAGQIFLPLLSNFLFICFLLFWGRERLWLTILPVGLGMHLFCIKGALLYSMAYDALRAALFFCRRLIYHNRTGDDSYEAPFDLHLCDSACGSYRYGSI